MDDFYKPNFVLFSIPDWWEPFSSNLDPMVTASQLKPNKNIPTLLFIAASHEFSYSQKDEAEWHFSFALPRASFFDSPTEFIEVCAILVSLSGNHIDQYAAWSAGLIESNEISDQVKRPRQDWGNSSRILHGLKQ